MNLSICCLNVRGLGDNLKRRELFNWLRMQKHSIYMLQEAHCSEGTNSMWSAEWGYWTIFSGQDSSKCGVAILFNNTFSFEIRKIFSDSNGRFVIRDIETEQTCVTLATLYAPNVDDPKFFELFFDHLYDFECDEIIIGGDFNLVLNIDMDKKGGLARTHLKSQETVKDRAAQLELVDAWRTINPDSRKYTWRRRKPEILCRLDFFLVSQGLTCSVTSANISAGYKTDRSLIDIKIALHSNLRGPGYWKLNTSFLTDIDYVTQIRDVIKKTHEEYRDDDTVNKGLLWEMMKLKIREQSIKNATAKKVQMSRREGELEKEINFLQNFIESNEINPNEKTEISGTLEARKRELEKMIEYRTKGSILRARCRWYNEGGKIRSTRFIGENIRLIDSVINFTAAKNIPGLLVFLDFEKAFNTIEWPFIHKTFHHFNFGSSILRWIKLFYHDIESCILNNGWSSNLFKLERGVRQGCPLSPYLFILCAEVLAHAIRKHNNIKGIFVDGQEIKISLYADDTTLILHGSRASFQNSLQILEFFRAISGLRLNYKKTEALWIGANAGSEEKLCPENDLRWMSDKVKTLGVWLSTDPEIMLKANYEEKITRLKASLGCWELRRLSLLGKITVLKSLIVSQLTYILSPLPTNQCAIDEVNTLFFKFLWDGKGDKIKRDIMISEYEDGGVKMIDIRLFTQALKLSWVKKYLDKGNEANGSFSSMYN